ncbi:MAG: sensor histidine kinase [Candidatus Choladocola sp.]|nr:sensor histidine kinase [Candidatus Choladocola sp.]
MKKSFGIFRFKSIRTSIMVLFSVLIICAMLIFTVFSMNYLEDAVIENSQDYSMQLIRQVNGNLNSYIDYMENIAYMITENQDVVSFLQAQPSEYFQIKNRLTEQFTTILDSRPDISNIGILGESGRYLFNRGDESLNYYVDYKDLDWYQKAISSGEKAVSGQNQKKVKAVLSASHVQNVIVGKYPWVVTLSAPVMNKETGKTEGVFFVDLNYSSINSLGQNISLGNRGYVFIVDDEKNIIFHPQQQLLHSGVKTEKIEEVLQEESGSFVTEEGENSKLYTFCRSEKTGWTVVGVSYLNELLKNQDEIQQVYYMTAVLLLFAAILLASLISGEISKPLKQLQHSMKEVEKGNFKDAAMRIEGDNEIADLGTSFQIMTEKIQQLMEQSVQEQREKRKSELNALQSQINPHFLYNTLDSIIWMAESGKNQEVVLMTSSLAKLLRQSISNEDEIVTVEKEIGYTRSYLTIQKMRYKDQLEFEIDVQEEALDMPIVKLVVQPLVENAIYHGIKYADHKGMIQVKARIMEEKLVIIISDNGPGMKPEVLAHILEKRSVEGKNGKVGVYNVHNRLQLYYGPEYGLSYESVEGVGTTVFMTIPNPYWKEDEDETFIQ